MLPPLSKRELAWYATGSIPGGVFALGTSYLVFYYNQVLGISGSLIGLAAVLISLFDALSDPIVGNISDHTSSRLGRRHPYLLGSAAPTALLFYLIWAPPSGLGAITLLAWLLALHLVHRLFYTFYNVPYLALGAEISSDHEERTRITTARNIYFHIGRAVAGAMLLLVFMRPTAEYPNGQLNPAGYPQFGWVFAIVILLALLGSAWQTRSWVPRLSSAEPARGPRLRGLWDNFREIVAYRSYRVLLFGSVSRHIAWGVSDTLGLYMATYFWQVDTSVLFLFGCGMFSGLFIGLPFWRKVGARREKRSICMIGDALYLAFFALPYLFKLAGFWPDNDSPLYVPLYVATTGFLAHFGIAASSALTGSMLGDVTDQDELQSGRRREGVILGAESFTWKAFTGLGPLITGIVIDVVGLSEKVSVDDVPERIVMGLGIAQGGVMAVCFVLALFFISRYDLSRRRHGEILARLSERADRLQQS